MGCKRLASQGPRPLVLTAVDTHLPQPTACPLPLHSLEPWAAMMGSTAHMSSSSGRGHCRAEYQKRTDM